MKISFIRFKAHTEALKFAALSRAHLANIQLKLDSLLHCFHHRHHHHATVQQQITLQTTSGYFAIYFTEAEKSTAFNESTRQQRHKKSSSRLVLVRCCLYAREKLKVTCGKSASTLWTEINSQTTTASGIFSRQSTQWASERDKKVNLFKWIRR